MKEQRTVTKKLNEKLRIAMRMIYQAAILVLEDRLLEDDKIKYDDALAWARLLL